ncbi:MAG: hypothetical protein CMG77_05830 [Marinimicrobium sp.]|nr:hypothetical protein [Marinimicrobium sp.]
MSNKSPYTEKPSGQNSVESPDSASSSADEDVGAPQDSTSETPEADPDSSTDDAVAEGGDSAEPVDASEEPAAEDNSDPVDSIEEPVSAVSGTVRLEWDRPEFRENGEYLEVDDIGGYELRYRRLGEEDFQTVVVESGWEEDYEFSDLEGSYQFSIAAFDNNGLYSEFVNLSPVASLTESL